MATVSELSDPYANFMINPAPPTDVDVCRRCTTFVDGYPTCYPCGFSTDYADAILPISYSIHFGQLHNNLAQYKRGVGRPAQRLRLELSAVIWRFLATHEQCLAAAAGTDAFELVCTVPSRSVDRDELHPLRTMLSKIVSPTATRYERLLRRSEVVVADGAVAPQRFQAERTLDGDDVLLIDDTWTTGASAESAAGALSSLAREASGCSSWDVISTRSTRTMPAGSHSGPPRSIGPFARFTMRLTPSRRW